jgi:hypothetical protein
VEPPVQTAVGIEQEGDEAVVRAEGDGDRCGRPWHRDARHVGDGDAGGVAPLADG